MDDALVMELWDLFREYIPEKNREMAANQYVDYLLGKDLTAEELGAFTGYDPHLDEAIKTVQVEEESFDDDEDDYNYNEDEE